jgi:Ca2+-binding EF-hand superfamily protein
MKGLQGERLRQAFSYFDKEETGVISVLFSMFVLQTGYPMVIIIC